MWPLKKKQMNKSVWDRTEAKGVGYSPPERATYMMDLKFPAGGENSFLR